MINIQMIVKLTKQIESRNKLIREARGSYQYANSAVTNIKKAVRNGGESYNRS
jgi:hypothetical protein